MENPLPTDAYKGISLADFAIPVPEEKDPDCLFKGEFLKKGGGLVITSISGSGKSVITMQLAYAWAMGRPMFGITPLRPLKIGIFQTEDDDREIAGFRANMRNGFERFCEWKPEDWQEAEKRIVFHYPQGRMGDAFIAFLREVQLRHHYDLVIVNPLQGVTDFDIAQNKDLHDFLRVKIDGVTMAKDTKCGMVLIHHTNKPPSAKDRLRFGKDQYAEYIGAGGSEITNWMRAMFGILPSNKNGVFYFIAGKRGERLDWPYQPKLKCAKPTKLIRHSTKDEKCIFWHEADPKILDIKNTSDNQNDDDDSNGDGKDSKDSKEPDIKKSAKTLAEKLKATAMTKTEARNAAKKLFGARYGNEVYNEMMDNLGEYGLTKKNTGNGSQCLIGTEESVKNRFSELPGGKTDE